MVAVEEGWRIGAADGCRTGAGERCRIVWGMPVGLGWWSDVWSALQPCRRAARQVATLGAIQPDGANRNGAVFE